MADVSQRALEVFREVVTTSDATLQAELLATHCGADLELRRQVEQLLHEHDSGLRLAGVSWPSVEQIAEPAGSFAVKGSTIAPPRPITDFMSRADIARGDATPPPWPSSTTAGQLRVDANLQNEEAGKLETLLRHIALQSHFEERYELRGTLASGGMGQVLNAYDRILAREIAIKMMVGGFDEVHTIPAIRGQFLKEAQVGGRLLHPNILPVFDLGVNRARKIYYTMRRVYGASLQFCLDSVATVVETKLISFPLRKMVKALLGACRGVDYAHQNGVIHLDLKPQNVLFSAFHEVFVIDWGLARVDEVDDTESLVDIYRGRARSENPELTNTGWIGGSVVGTPAYMAPEQAAGDLSSFSPMTDVFGLGGILYFILYGKPPNQIEACRPDDLVAATTKPKERGNLRPGILPRGRRVQTQKRQAIEALESICLRALAANPQDRYPDVEKLIVDLNDWFSSSQGT